MLKTDFINFVFNKLIKYNPTIIETDIEMGPMDLIRVKLPVGKSDSDMDVKDNVF